MDEFSHLFYVNAYQKFVICYLHLARRARLRAARDCEEIGGEIIRKYDLCLARVKVVGCINRWEQKIFFRVGKYRKKTKLVNKIY